MLKRYLIVAATSLCLGAGPVLADHEQPQPQHQQGNNPLPFELNKENVGKGVGAAVGALLGSQFGDGKGQLAAVAAGTLAGYWVGGRIGERLSQRDQAGIAHTTQRALKTGDTQTWRNPDTGVATRVSVSDAEASADRRGRPAVEQTPPLEMVNALYTANARVNVRGGPSTDYGIVYQLREGEQVPVIGRVSGKDWLMLAENGAGSGFVYEPLLSRSGNSGNAIRESVDAGESFSTHSAASSQCRLITQEVTLPDDTSRRHEFKACKQPDGSWQEV